MPSFNLRPLDDEKDIAVPFGKTTIGRGPFLGVTDKRVSRSHAVLEVTDENLSILPLHTNPTFLKASDSQKFISLKKDEIRVLINGDVIALLPDSLCFMVVCHGDSCKTGVTEGQLRFSESNNVHDEGKPTKSSNTSTDMLLDEFTNNGPSSRTCSADAVIRHADGNFTDSKPSTQDMATASSSLSVSETDVISPSKPLIEPAPFLQKTRKLPSWLIESTTHIKSPAKNSVNKRRGTLANQDVDKEMAASKKDNKGRNKTTQRGKSSVEEDQKVSSTSEDFIVRDDDEHDRGRAKCKFAKKRSSINTEDNEEDVKSTARKKAKTSRILVTENDVVNEPVVLKSKEDVGQTFLGDTNTGGNDDEVSASKNYEKESDKMTFPPCPYGKKCYRKNPLHFKEYLHPDKGSSDDNDDDNYKVAADDNDDDRPVCPYGSSCYRHFKHTDTLEHPKHKTRKKRSILDGTSDDDDDGPNTYDYNDSFLADDTSVVEEASSSYSGSDDSDWQPVHDDDDDEDVNELLHEAKGFLRSKKMTKPV